MGSLDIDSLFTNIPLEEPSKFTLRTFLKTKRLSWFEKSEFKDLLFSVTKESYFIFNNTLYKQIDGVVIGSPFGPSLDALWNIDHSIIDGMLMIYLYFLNHLIT